VPDGTPARPATDTLQLLKLMSMRSEVIELRLAAAPESINLAIEELPPAAPSVLDQLVQARIRSEEAARAEDVPTGLAAPLFAQPIQARATPGPVERISTLEPEDWTAEEEIAILEAAEPALDLLELNAAEAGQPVETGPLALPSFDEPEPPGSDSKLAAIEPDRFPAQPLELGAGIEDVAILMEDRLAGEQDVARQTSDGEPVGAIEAIPEAAELEPEDDNGGAGEDFRALLAGARQLEPAPAVAREVAEDEDLPLLPADGDVKLRARNGPKPGAEFVGKSTLAGASGLYCLIERFNLPAGTRMKVTLTAPRFADRFDIQDAVVKRVRRAPANTTEVQLAFDQRHQDFEDFVAQHFGDKPVGFALFTRRRPPKRKEP